MPQIDAIRFRKYKSFGEEFSTIPLKRMTVMIGRNNSGKSSCIDVIEAIICKKSLIRHQFIAQVLLSDDDSSSLDFKTSNNGQHKQLGWFHLRPTLCGNAFSFNVEHIHDSDDNKAINIINNRLNNMKVAFFRLNADRDICPERDGHGVFLHPDGTGATSLIQCILNDEGQDERLILRCLLDDLNSILYPDITYSKIAVQKIKNKTWEVFLYEGDERFALSKMGSGMKTLILVLLNIIVLPKIKNFPSYGADICVYALEEIENNLHPALQRKLFKYIRSYCNNNANTYFVMTTHSQVPINIFANQDNAQILHVVREHGVSSIETIGSLNNRNKALDDLGVRASDLLHSNGIIWVEGPSDRIYLKRWMEIWGGGDLREGIDYQFLYYGGRLLSHYSAEEAQAENDLIGILTTNRNSAIVIDSDKRTPRSRINATKQRIQKEFKAKQLFCWITQGKEIENYVSSQAINATYKSHLPQCGLNELFPTYIEKNATTKKAFGKGKVSFASEVVKHITADDSSKVPGSDLKRQITELIKRIRGWTSDKQSARI